MSAYHLNQASRVNADGCCKCVVAIKIGTSALISDSENCTVNLRALASLAESVRRLKDADYQVIVISSGAVGAGCQKLGFKTRPDDVSVRQALAAVGQVHLMRFYEDLFSAVGLTCSQVLLTLENLADRDQYHNAQATFRQLLKFGVVPIVNENDCVAVEHDRIGDNDTLAAQVATLVQAEWLFLLTDVDALYTSDPAVDPTATPIREVADMADLLRVDTSSGFSGEGGGDGKNENNSSTNSCSSSTTCSTTTPESGSQWGTGGMATKLVAANVATAAGTRMVICNGDPEIVPRVVLDKEQIGTVFLPAPVPIVHGFKRWILSAPTRGQIFVSNEATEVLRNNQTVPLTVDGVLTIEGEFSSGDAVVLKNEDGAEVGRGVVSLPAEFFVLGDGGSLSGGSSRREHRDIVVEGVNMCLLPTSATHTAVSEVAEEEVKVVEEEEVIEKVSSVSEKKMKKVSTPFGCSSASSSLQSTSLVSSPTAISSAGGSRVLLDPNGLLEEDERLVLELEMAAKKLISMRVD